MRRAKKIAAALALAFALALVPAMALAQGGSSAAGNTFETSKGGMSSQEALTAQRDCYWAGQTLDPSEVSIGSDLVAAGQTITISGGSVGGSIRAASQSLSVTGTVVTDNITAAGETVSIGSDATCAGAYLVGKNVSFGGVAEELWVGGQNVVISGTVNGDVRVDAQSVTVEDGAVITGNLSVRSANEPTIAAGAKVDSVDYVHAESTSADKTEGFDFKGLLYLTVVFCLISLILTWVFPVAVDGAAAMVRQRPVAHLVTGLIGMVAAIPVALVLLLVAPLAGAFACVVVAIFLVAAPFAGASAMRLAVPGWNRFGAAAAGGAAAGVICSIPYVQGVAVAIAFIYLLGYVLQSIHRGMHAPAARELEEDSAPGQGTPSEPTPVPPAGTEPQVDSSIQS